MGQAGIGVVVGSGGTQLALPYPIEGISAPVFNLTVIPTFTFTEDTSAAADMTDVTDVGLAMWGSKNEK